MAFSLESIFTTATAVPSEISGITEVEPIDYLKPYVRCFWFFDGSQNACVRIIPDFCADIIIDLKSGSAQFVGISNESFVSHNNGCLFGIRFYAWAVCRFTRSVSDFLFNNAVSAENVFDKFNEFSELIIHEKSTSKRISIAQKYLVDLLNDRYDADVMNSLFYSIMYNGNVNINQLSRSCAVSRRTLERKFVQNLGISPKTSVELLRYQLLWQHCIGNNFCINDCVDKFGYYDQPHLYNDFKKYHGIGLSEARNEYLKLSHIYNTFK